MKISILNFIKSKKNLLLVFLIAIFIRIIVRIIFINIVTEINDPESNLFVSILFSTCEPYRDYEFFYQNYANKLLYDPTWIPYKNTIGFAFLDFEDYITDHNLDQSFD